MADPDTVPWHGYINQILHGTDLRAPLSNQLLARLVDALIEQRYFNHPVEDYYRAAATGLKSGESFTIDGSDEEEKVARDLFARLLPALDERHPWPEPAFRSVDADDSPASLRQPIIGRIELRVDKVENKLHRHFHSIATDAGERAVLTLRLRSGTLVKLVGRRTVEPNIDLRADADPAATIAEFREATGIDVVPASTQLPSVPQLHDPQ